MSDATPAAHHRRRVGLGYLALAVLAYAAPLLAQPGQVIADTKNYLYLDPARLLARTAFLWDEHTGAGTVTHQNIGYLFPMGPWFRLFDGLGVPDWIAQRLWLGSILFAAGAGVLYLCRSLRLAGPGAVAAAVVYMLSPYSLHYAARLSVILLPWAALGWLLGFTVRALRRGGWRHAALFAVVASAAGSVNATAVAFVCLAPALWMAWNWLVLREVNWQRTLSIAAKIGGLTALTSAWWVIPLAIEREYGINLLKTTETIETVARTSTAPEVLRGLGHWFFYGRDKLGPWIEASVDYTQALWVIAAGYFLASLALAAAGALRWRLRGYFVTLLALGTTIAVGAYPYNDSSPFGRVLQRVAEGSSVGLALRSTGRAVPLVALALAMFLGAGVVALSHTWDARPAIVARRTGSLDRRRASLLAAGAIVVIAIVAFPVLFNGNMYGENLDRDEAVPSYWTEAIAYLDERPHDTRVLELPGADFASYRWGNAVDPITPGLLDRPWLSRELIPLGSHATADLVNSLDRRLQEGVWEDTAIAPVARYLAAGDVVLRLDLESDRYNLVRSYEMVDAFSPTPPGLDGPTAFGTRIPGALRYPQADERFLLARAAGVNTTDGPPVLVYAVDHAVPIVRTQAVAAPVIMSGDGEGVVDISAAGIVDGTEPLLFSASFAGSALRDQVTPGAAFVVTDTNRKRARRWNTMRDNPGYTETADSVPLVVDPTDARLPIFDRTDTDSQTVVELRGVSSVEATGYGNTITYTPEDRPANAIDGNDASAWRTGGFRDVVGERIRIALNESVTTDHIEVVQPLTGPRNRWITEATLTFDGRDPVRVTLDDRSRTNAGQRIEFPSRRFSTVEIRVEASNAGPQATYTGWSPVGFAEIRIAGVQVSEFVRLPTDVADELGDDVAAHPYLVVMTRLRSIGLPIDHDEETTMRRIVTVPNDRKFSLGGTVRLSPNAVDEAIDQALGIPNAAQGGVTANSSERLPGSVNARAMNAIDGDPTTAWTTPFVGVQGQSVNYALASSITFDRMSVTVNADQFHSRPRRLQLRVGDDIRIADLSIPRDATGSVTVPVEFQPITGTDITVTLEEVDPIEVVDYMSETRIQAPVSIIELGIPGLTSPAPDPTAFGTCRPDLVRIDGEPVSVRIDGSTGGATGRDPLTLVACDDVELSAGGHDVEMTPGSLTGWDVDRLVFSSAAGGAAGAIPEPGRPPGSAAGTEPQVLDHGPVSTRVQVPASADAQWLVLGQSINAGWTARVVGGDDLGAPTLINGYANGWKLDAHHDALEVVIEWTPQRAVAKGVWISALAALMCLVIAIGSWIRSRGDDATVPTAVIGFAPIGDGSGIRPSGLAIAGVTLLVGALGATLAQPWVGLLLAVLTVTACVVPRTRVLFTLGSPVALALAGAYVVMQQFRHDYPPAFEWPTFFASVHVLGWLAVLLLATDVLVGFVRRTER